MIIAGYAIGAEQGFIYVRAEYPLAVQRCREALSDAEVISWEKTFWKRVLTSILRSDRSRSFVCGEETALISSIEGTSDPKPPPAFPGAKGLWGKPTLINNGRNTGQYPADYFTRGRSFSQLARGTAQGVALAGKIRHGGLVEVPWELLCAK